MEFLIGNKRWDQFNLATNNSLIVLCAEIHDDRMSNVEEQLRNGFGLTMLGGMTVQLDRRSDILKLNYKIEASNQVGLCLPYSLIITPRGFYHKLYNNTFDDEMFDYIKDIRDANELHIHAPELYFGFYRIRPSKVGCLEYWESDAARDQSIDNLKKTLLKLSYNHTKKIYFDILDN